MKALSLLASYPSYTANASYPSIEAKIFKPLSSLRWIIATLHLLIVFTLYSPLGHAEKILLAFPMVSSEHYQKVLSDTPHSLSIMDFLEVQTGRFPEDMDFFEHQNNDTHNEAQNEEQDHRRKQGSVSASIILENLKQRDPRWPLLLEGFLSPAKKTLLIQWFSRLRDQNPSPTLQATLRELQRPLNSSRSGVPIPWVLLRPDDRLYLNGERISNHEWPHLRLDKNSFYHWAYFSSTHHPTIRWATVEEIGALELIPFMDGDCENPPAKSHRTIKMPLPFEAWLKDSAIYALDRHGKTCLAFPNPLNGTLKERTLAERTLPSAAEEANAKASSWTTPAAWATAALGGGFLIYQAQKKFEFEFKWGF